MKSSLHLARGAMLDSDPQGGNYMTEFQTGAVRDTGGKGRMDLLPWCALLRVSRHMEDAILPDPETGQPHYPERNWEKGLPIHSMMDSAFRHLAKYVDGWDDEDHLCAAATNLLMAMWMEEKMPEMQDIPARDSQRNNTEINLTPSASKGLIEKRKSFSITSDVMDDIIADLIEAREGS